MTTFNTDQSYDTTMGCESGEWFNRKPLLELATARASILFLGYLSLLYVHCTSTLPDRVFKLLLTPVRISTMIPFTPFTYYSVYSYIRFSFLVGHLSSLSAHGN